MQSGEITTLLREWQVGAPEAFEQLVKTAYPSLRSIAEAYLRHERPGHTLQATALVNELYLKLVHQRKPEWKDRAHFFTFAAKLMRMILIDHSRANKARKRGGDSIRVPLTPELPWLEANEEGLLDLEQALQELERLDAKKVRIIELRFFLGATAEETAETLGISKATVDREMKFVRSWLAARLRRDEPAG